MKLQPASKKEVTRIAIGTSAFSVIMIAVMAFLSWGGIGKFDYTIFTGAIGGAIVAIVNFAMMCLTIQNAVNISEQKQMKAFIQGSYNGRLLFQAAWIVVAFMVSHINVFAASIPLLFPTLTIFYLQKKGTLVTPSDRKNTPAAEEDEPEDRLESFEV